MKYRIFVCLIVLVLPGIVSAGADGYGFSDLNSLCTWSTDGEHLTSPTDKLILPHIDKRITKTEGYVKSDNYLYMVANTFTDNYRFLGAYLIRYDCREKNTEKLTGLLKANIPNELGFIWYNEFTNIINFALVGKNNGAYWIYDIGSASLKKINSRKIPQKRGKILSYSPDLSTYDGKSIGLNIYYSSRIRNGDGSYTYSYENNGQPLSITYTF